MTPEMEELRALIRESHEAIKDLTKLLREYKKAAADGTKAAGERAHDAADKKLREFFDHLQAESNHNAAELNKSVERAKDHVMKRLLIARMEIDKDSDMARFYFEENTPFDEHAEVIER